MKDLAQVTPENIREVMIGWILETDNDTIERVWNENFDEDITFLHDQGVFEISVAEAERNGIDLNIKN